MEEFEKMENKEVSGKRIIELREKAGMTRNQFCEYLGIPYRTLQAWELGDRSMPDYLLRLIAYKVDMDLKNNKKGDGENGKKA